MTGSNWAAAISGIRNNASAMRSDVQTSGEVIPVNTERAARVATSAAITSRVTRVLLAARHPERNAHTLQQPTIAAYAQRRATQIH